MNKKIRLLICASILFSQLSPVTTVAGDTDETGSTTTTETTEPENSVSPSETTESLSEENTSTKESKETKDSSEKASDPEGVKPAGGPIPFGTTLIEGVEIDADFATLLRTNKATTNDGGAWSGYGKAQDQLTFSDMAAIEAIDVSSKSLTSLKGIEYAVNITSLICNYNKLVELDMSQNPALKLLECRNNQLTKLDISGSPLLEKLDCQINKLTELDVSQNPVLTELICLNNQLVELDMSQNPALDALTCSDNKLVELDMSQNPALKLLECQNNQLTKLDISESPLLSNLMCQSNKLAELDVSQNPALGYFLCFRNELTELDVSQNPLITELNCMLNKISELDVSQNPALKSLFCSSNWLTELDISQNAALIYLGCGDNGLVELDVSQNPALISIECRNSQLAELDVSQNPVLTELNCSSNRLTELDVSQNPALTGLDCFGNRLTELDVSQNLALTTLNCRNNELVELDMSQNPSLYSCDLMGNKVSDLTKIVIPNTLSTLNISNNSISDITPLYGLTNLSFNATGQKITIPLPEIIDGKAVIEKLKTTAEVGLTATNGDITGSPSITTNGDTIELANVTPESLNDKYFNFSYNGSQLTEGNTGSFGGQIFFAKVTQFEGKLKPNVKKVASDSEVEWTWGIEKKASSNDSAKIYAKLSLPSGLEIDPSSIKVDGNPVSMMYIDGTHDLGDSGLSSKTITFTTIATGSVGQWLKPTAHLRWTDETIYSPYEKESDVDAVQIKDDEQTFTPKDLNDMALLSTPESFRFGTGNLASTAQIIKLHSSNYLTNTQVVSDGFYTRLRDDRNVSTGWKLSAQLSEFKDNSNNLMPNGSGSSLRMEDMAIENITDRDTPVEAINPSPIGTPSTIVTDETLVAGQTAKTLVSANSGEGAETWQLRIPFDKVSLNLPANAGQKNKNYSATLTWSLDDTP